MSPAQIQGGTHEPQLLMRICIVTPRLRGRQNWFPGEAAKVRAQEVAVAKRRQTGAGTGTGTMLPLRANTGSWPCVARCVVSCRTMTTSSKQRLSCFIQSLRTDCPRPWFDVKLKGDKAMASPTTGVRDAIQAVSWTRHPGMRGLTL